jgi:sec-independent protein translocase protein TatB
MFGVGAEEFIAILVVALIVLGPERLPVAMRQIGQWARRLRDMSREFREEFAEEFSIIQEEMGELRREAEVTRGELAEIRRELGQTVQKTADEVTDIRKEMTEDVQGAVDALSGRDTNKGSATKSLRKTATKSRASIAAPGNGSSTSSPATEAAESMALAIAETFATNGVAALSNDASDPPVKSVATPASDVAAPRLNAFAPDVGPPVEPLSETDSMQQPSLPNPMPAPTYPQEAVSAGIGSPLEPGLRNQMGGFMRLIIMNALESDPAFRGQAEASLRAQARVDAEPVSEREDAGVLDLVDAWVRQRRQLVARGSVTVEQKAPDSAVVELHECPYGLKQGDAHPVCDVSNIYDAEFFDRFGLTAMYASRMSDGAAKCKLLVVTNERLQAFEEKKEPAEA